VVIQCLEVVIECLEEAVEIAIKKSYRTHP